MTNLEHFTHNYVTARNAGADPDHAAQVAREVQAVREVLETRQCLPGREDDTARQIVEVVRGADSDDVWVYVGMVSGILKRRHVDAPTHVAVDVMARVWEVQ